MLASGRHNSYNVYIPTNKHGVNKMSNTKYTQLTQALISAATLPLGERETRLEVILAAANAAYNSLEITVYQFRTVQQRVANMFRICARGEKDGTAQVGPYLIQIDERQRQIIVQALRASASSEADAVMLLSLFEELPLDFDSKPGIIQGFTL